MKNSFVVYTEILEYAGDLTDEQLGQLYRAQLTYATGGTPVVTDPEVRGIWRVMKHRMDVDAEKYESKCQQLRANASKCKQMQADATKSQQTEGDTVTVTDIDTDTDKTIKTRVRPAKRRFGQHVLLTAEEYAKLIAEYGEAQANAAVDYLDEYIERKGYKAKSHYLAIRKWVFDAMHEEEVKRRELEQREQRLRDQSKPRGGHFAGERKDDIDGEVLSGAIRRITADGNEDDRDRPREAAGRDW